jgi:hypothetical protein
MLSCGERWAHGQKAMAGLDDALKLLGFGTPLIYAAATYGLFRWLDTNASDEAKAALASAVKLREYDKKQVASALVEVFDRLYTRPLFSRRAFIRSALITLLLFVIYIYESPSAQGMLFARAFRLSGGFSGPFSLPFKLAFSLSLITNIITDYCSLFVVRRWLLLFGGRASFALLSGSLVAGLIIFCGLMVRYC